MRSRSDLGKMRKRVDPERGSLTPGSEPHIWVLPHWVEYGSAEMDDLIREKVKEMCEYWLAPGCDLRMELVGHHRPFLAAEPEAQIRFSAVRRDTNSLRDARWTSTPRGPCND